MTETSTNIESKGFQTEANSSEHLIRAQNVVDSKASRIKKPGFIRGALAAGTLFMAAACNSSVPPSPAYSPEFSQRPTASEVIQTQKPETSPTPQSAENLLYQRLDIKEIMTLMKLGDSEDIIGEVEPGLIGEPSSEWLVAQDESFQKLLSFSLEALKVKGENFKDIQDNFHWQLVFPNENTSDYTQSSWLSVGKTVNPEGLFEEVAVVGLYSSPKTGTLIAPELRQRLVVVTPKETFDPKGLSNEAKEGETSPLDKSYHEYLQSILKLPANAYLPKYGNSTKSPLDWEYTGSFISNGKEVGFASSSDGKIYLTDQATY